MRLIDADKLLKEIEDWCDSLGGTMNPTDWGIQNVLQSVMDCIIESPDIDVNPVRHGRWVEARRMVPPERHHRKYCSLCGGWVLQDHFGRESMSHYCPYCGAKMEL